MRKQEPLWWQWTQLFVITGLALYVWIKREVRGCRGM